MSLNPPFLFSYNVPDNLVAGETLDLDGLLRDDHNDSEDHSGISERAQPAGGDENGNYGHEDASAAGHDSADGAIDGHSRDEAAAAAPGRVRPKACDSCYKLRIRCSLASLDDTVMPEGLVCESCAALNCACTFTRAVLARGPKKGVPRAPQRRKTHRIGKKTHRKVVGPKAQAAEHAPPSRQPADLQNGPGADDTGLAGECLRQNVTVDGEGSILGSEEEFQLWLGSGRDLGFLFPVAETNTAALDAPVLQYPSKTIEDTELVPAIARHVALDPPNLIGVRRNDQHAVGSNLPVSPAFVHSSSTVPSETAHVVHVGREIGPFESLDVRFRPREIFRSLTTFRTTNSHYRRLKNCFAVFRTFSW